ncbi:hypothetical protein GCM10022381_10570 [Leifsonia kafniensis]|uniref:Uncharacterized protein n=1 Tax=Leifsonia kafniensis TaxID=475957 RepID=A0ABP7K878_9MICO
MTQRRALFGWKVTRLLFACGVFAIMTGALRLVLEQSPVYFWLILAGIALMALATRGQWDSRASGRNRSVLGFRARPADASPKKDSRTSR